MLTRLHDALRLRTSPVIFFASAAIIILFSLATILFTDAIGSGTRAGSDWLLKNLGWFYIGRTIRQFVSGVLAIPAGFSVIWFGVFGMSALDIELNGDGGLVKTVVEDQDVPGSLFAFLEHYPAAGFTSVIAIILVVIFFVTSVDSAALVTDTMANGHEDFNPLGQRIFWAVAIGLLTATLLVFSGKSGLDAFQTTITLVGLPFFVLACFQMWSLYRALLADAGELPQVRTRQWKKVLPPEEFERHQDDNAHDMSDVVIEPEAEGDAPVMADPYVSAHPLRPAGTLASRTGSKPLGSAGSASTASAPSAPREGTTTWRPQR